MIRKLNFEELKELENKQFTHQELFYLRLYSQGLGYQDIADLMDLTRQRVAEVIRVAMAKVEKYYGK